MSAGTLLPLVAALAVFAGAAVEPAAGGHAPYQSCEVGVLGDVTGDDVVDAGDAQQLLRASASLSVTSTVAGRLGSHGDVNGDTQVDAGDAQQVLRYAASLSVAYPIGDPLCGAGNVVVRNQTSGPLPSNPYTVTLDGGAARDMPPGTVTNPGFAPVFEGVSVGQHTIQLGNVPGNCSVVGGTTINAEVVEGAQETTVNFSVECT